MARVSKHGTEIGTINYLTKSLRYMSDGTLLRNDGFGWKMAKVKPGVEINQESFEAAKKRREQYLAERPATAAYVQCLHNLAGVGKRWKLHAAVTMLPDDADGVWSEACDGYGDNISADVDEIVELCRAYRVALLEANDIRKENAA